MFGKKKAHMPQRQIDSLIGASTTIQGDINFTGGLRVDGAVNGHIHSTGEAPSTLVVSEKAKINGEIRVSAEDVCLAGYLSGYLVVRHTASGEDRQLLSPDQRVHSVDRRNARLDEL